MTMVSVYSFMVKNMNNEHHCRLCGRMIVQRYHNARYCLECATNMVEMSAYHYTIPLPPITKKNSPRIGYVGAHCPVCHKGKYAKVLPSAAYIKYAKAAKPHLKPAPPKPLDGRYNVKCLYYMPTRHKVDKTNLESAIMDILVDAKILKDDNSSIVAATDGSRVLYDKENPRTEIIIQELEE